jgi:hypothetical protein
MAVYFNGLNDGLEDHQYDPRNGRSSTSQNAVSK